MIYPSSSFCTHFIPHCNQGYNEPLHVSSPLSKYHPVIHVSQVVASSHTRQLRIQAAEEGRDTVSLNFLFGQTLSFKTFFLGGGASCPLHFRHNSFLSGRIKSMCPFRLCRKQSIYEATAVPRLGLTYYIFLRSHFEHFEILFLTHVTADIFTHSLQKTINLRGHGSPSSGTNLLHSFSFTFRAFWDIVPYPCYSRYIYPFFAENNQFTRPRQSLIWD